MELTIVEKNTGCRGRCCGEKREMMVWAREGAGRKAATQGNGVDMGFQVLNMSMFRAY